MIIGGRQIEFGAVRVPEIEWKETINLTSSLIVIMNALGKAVTKKTKEPYYEQMIYDSVTQTLNFLMNLGAINEIDVRKEVINSLKEKEIELWQKWIPLTPIYEGINMQLGTMLIKKHFPEMYKNMTDNSKPIEKRVYSHYGLTTIKESVLYTMEYLQKEGLLKDELKLINEEYFKDWIKNDH